MGSQWYTGHSQVPHSKEHHAAGTVETPIVIFHTKYKIITYNTRVYFAVSNKYHVHKDSGAFLGMGSAN